MTFLTILRVTEILCSFRLVLEGKVDEEIPESSRLEFLEVFSKHFCFIRCRRQHLQAVEKRSYSRFTFVENTTGNSPKVPRSKFLGSDGLFCFISILLLLIIFIWLIHCTWFFVFKYNIHAIRTHAHVTSK